MPRSTRTHQPDIRATITALSNMPRQIAGVARGCTDRRLHRKPEPGAWSARDIVAHLRACANVWGHSIERMLAEDRPTIRYVSPRGWIDRTDYLDQRFRDLLHAFTAERASLVTSLGARDGTGWSRGATFTGTTAGRRHTVLSYAERIADHEARHLDQLRRTLGR